MGLDRREVLSLRCDLCGGPSASPTVPAPPIVTPSARAPDASDEARKELRTLAHIAGWRERNFKDVCPECIRALSKATR